MQKLPLFIQQAWLGNNKWFMYLITIFLVVIGFVIGQIPLTVVLIAKMTDSNLSFEEQQAFAQTMDFSKIGLDANLGIALLLLSFVAAFVVLWICIVAFHKRPIKTAITARPKMDWSRVGVGAGIWLLFMVLSDVYGYYTNPENYVYQFDLAGFIPLLLITLLLFPIQTSFEELFMRGYLLQGIGTGLRSPIAAWIITSLIFGVLHISNPEVAEFGVGIMMTFYISMGLFLGICTILDNGLELALGVHAANNMYGALLVTFGGSAIQTPAVFRMKEFDPQFGLIAGTILMIIFIIIASRIYKWSDWSRLYKKLPGKPVLETEPDDDPVGPTPNAPLD